MSDYVQRAIEEEPEGKVCYFCKKDNDFADDIGWFHLSPSKNNYGFCCKSCYEGPIGDQHRKKYGVGER